VTNINITIDKYCRIAISWVAHVNYSKRKKKKKQKEALVIWYIMPFHKQMSAKIFRHFFNTLKHPTSDITLIPLPLCKHFLHSLDKTTHSSQSFFPVTPQLRLTKLKSFWYLCSRFTSLSYAKFIISYIVLQPWYKTSIHV